MAFAFPMPKLPKDLKATKGDVTVMAVGGVLGLVVDIALHKVAGITPGTASAAGAAAAFSVKSSAENAVKEFKQQRQKGRAAKRAATAFAVFKENGYSKGAAAVVKTFDLYARGLISALELDAAVNKQLEAYKKAPATAKTSKPSAPGGRFEQIAKELEALHPSNSTAAKADSIPSEVIREYLDKTRKSGTREINIEPPPIHPYL
jgi:hypothetical protein